MMHELGGDVCSCAVSEYGRTKVTVDTTVAAF